MSHLHEKKRKILMTSHVLVMAAWEFVPPNSSRRRRILALICTAPLSRALVANVFVQTRKHLKHKVVDFFLHEKVIRAFRIPILFVYCVLMDCWGYSGCIKKLISTVQRISETMPHIQTLDIEQLPRLEDHEQVALAEALPKRLWSLRLTIEGFCFDTSFVTQLAESCPFLQRLELRDVDSDACEVLFSPDKNLFPNLRRLSIVTTADSSLELFDRVFSSQVVSSRRLEAFEFFSFCELPQQPFPAPSLEPLECLRSISSLLACSNLTTVPDFSVLKCCSELSGLLDCAILEDDQEEEDDDYDDRQDGVVIDLSTMPCLTSLGPSTLAGCKGVHTLVLPPTLRTVGSGFCERSTVERIDVSFCADSLRFVDTEKFLSDAAVETFSTLPLLGKIGTVVEDSFLYGCEKLQRVDLRGLKGIVEVGDSFLAGTALEELDLSALGPTCTKVGDWFLAWCYSLQKVTGGLSSVTSVGTDFLRKTDELQEFDFAAMKALASLDMEGLLFGCALREKGMKIFKGIIEEKNGSERARR